MWAHVVEYKKTPRDVKKIQFINAVTSKERNENRGKTETGASNLSVAFYLVKKISKQIKQSIMI